MAKPSKKTPNKTSPPKKKPKKTFVAVPTNTKEKLVDLGITSPYNFLSVTGSTFTEIFPIRKTSEGKNQYEIAKKPKRYSTCLKLVLNIQETKDLSELWSLNLWNIMQTNLLDKDVDVTFVRSLERRDKDAVARAISRRHKITILSSEKEDNVKKQSISVRHDRGLIQSINRGDSVLGFAAEVWVTAPTQKKLEDAVVAITDYLKSNDEMSGLHYELDINKQDRPLILFGPNKQAGNQDVYLEMTSEDAATTGLFVDSGGDRVEGAEYIGVSVGKLIDSHAAYSFQHSRSLYIGNNTRNGTPTIGGDHPDRSRVYYSKIASRSYLLQGHNVLHIVADNKDTAPELMAFELDDSRKQYVDVSKGLLNIIEPIRTKDVDTLSPERMLGRFNTHLENIVILLNQFRDRPMTSITTNDPFAKITIQILKNFFKANKYWDESAILDTNVLRLYVQHDHFKTLSDFGLYVRQKRKSNVDNFYTDALAELDTIIERILSTIPSLNVKTSPIIDNLAEVMYKVVDLTGTGDGSIATIDSPSMNTMMIAYLNALLPSLKNRDVVFLHGLSRLSSIGQIVVDIITSRGLDLDIVFTEETQTAALKLMDINLGKITTEEGKELALKLDRFDFVLVDLYQNRVDGLIDKLDMDKQYVTTLSNEKGSCFIKNNYGIDYVYMDYIL